MSSRAAQEKWDPFYSGTAAEAVRRIVFQVGSDSIGPSSRERADGSLTGGEAGLALYRFNAFALTGDRYQQDLAQTHLDKAIRCLSLLPMTASLYRGFTGITWLIAHLSGRFLDADHYSTSEIDETLLRYIETDSCPSFDLASGLIGIGVYFLERLPDPRATAGVELITENLSRRAIREGDRSRWITPAMLLTPEKQLAHPSGMTDLGMAHGLSGVIAFLSQVVRSNIGISVARPLLAAAVHELLAARITGSVSEFPYWLETRGDTSRLAWCYGDLSAALSLYTAGKITDENEWCDVALQTARRAATRPQMTSGVGGAGLCHGSAGIAHVFYRLYRSSGDEVLRQAADGWFQKTLQRLSTHVNVEQSESPLLEGPVGARLALLSTLSGTAPAWDSILLASVP